MCNKKVCTISNLVCPTCGNTFPIPRHPGRSRERNHIKTVWCPFCGRMTQMMEVRERDFCQLDNITER